MSLSLSYHHHHHIIILSLSDHHNLIINITINQLEAKRSAAEGKISAEKSAKEAAEGLHTQLVDEKVHGDDGGGHDDVEEDNIKQKNMM